MFMAAFSLEPDCKNCVAFCCVALAFDAGEHFSFDKNAAVPCPHLDADHYCSIHSDLKSKGFSGCVRYNCFGAGQRVTQDIFGGKSWRDHPELADEMFEAFSTIEKLHGLISMLDAAKKLDLPLRLETVRKSHQEELEALSIQRQDLHNISIVDLRAKVESFLAGLREEVSQSALRS